MAQVKPVTIVASGTDSVTGNSVEVCIPLATVCGACGGAGLIQNPAWSEYFERGAPVGQEPRNSRGMWMPEEIGCVECEVVGLQVTQQGRELLEFVRRFTA
jgi:hypothetical protein